MVWIKLTYLSNLLFNIYLKFLSNINRFIQFITLLVKNFVIISRKPIQLLIFLLLPGTFYLTFLIELNVYDDDTSNNQNLPTIPIQNLGSCDAYDLDNCIRIVYDNAGDIRIKEIMNELIISNNLNAAKDVVGFDTQFEAQQYVADNLGKVQFTIFFRNESLWETWYYSPNGIPLIKNMSYVIFYNESTNNDSRSIKYNLNFPLLVLQKSLDEAYLKTNYPNKFKNYIVDYGSIWSYSPEIIVQPIQSNDDFDDYESDDYNYVVSNTTDQNCIQVLRTNATIITGLVPWIFIFAFLLIANIPFQMISEERHKKLFTTLRRLGLMDSAYWASWFVFFEILLLISCSISMIYLAVLKEYSEILANINYDILFCLFFMSGTAMITFSFFMAVFCKSSSTANSITFIQLLAAMITIAVCSSSVNYYALNSYGLCTYIASSYSALFSPQTFGSSFFQFIIYFMPWFYSANALTNIMSVVQYQGQSISMSDVNLDKVISALSPLVLDPKTYLFDAESIGFDFLYLFYMSLTYIFLAFFFWTDFTIRR